MLISHKEIANYIDRLPKQKVDGWRGVSERFTHIHLNNNFTQTYEIIATVIQKIKSSGICSAPSIKKNSMRWQNATRHIGSFRICSLIV